MTFEYALGFTAPPLEAVETVCEGRGTQAGKELL